nr:MAG TPA: hypothetical protein [Caudoviricetes sp.]
MIFKAIQGTPLLSGYKDLRLYNYPLMALR